MKNIISFNKYNISESFYDNPVKAILSHNDYLPFIKRLKKLSNNIL